MGPQLPVARLFVAFVLLLVVPAGAGCRSSTETAALPAKKAATLFLADVQRYQRESAFVGQRTVAMMKSAQRGCAAIPRHPSHKVRYELTDVAQTYSEIFQVKLASPSYIEMSARLAKIPTSSAALRTIARSDSVVASEARKLLPYKADFCGTIRSLRARRWSMKFVRRVAMTHAGTSRLIDEHRLTRARQAAEGTSGQLRKLGLHFFQAAALITSSSFI